MDINRPKLLVTANAYARKIVAENHLNEEVPAALRERGIKALETELSRTKNLSDWPCLSFRQEDVAELPLSADLLSPDCSDNFVKCSVPIDIRGG